MNRRNDRGYNSDMDSGARSGRGSMRGRGGRGRGRGGGDRYNSGSTISDYVNNLDKRKYMGNGRGRGGGHATANGRPPRGGGVNRDRLHRDTESVGMGDDRERK